MTLNFCMTAVLKLMYVFVGTFTRRNLMISEAFLRFFVETCGHHIHFFTEQPNGTMAFQVKPIRKSLFYFVTLHVKIKNLKMKKKSSCVVIMSIMCFFLAERDVCKFTYH